MWILCSLIEVFNETIRVIKPPGNIIHNLGDKYLNSSLLLVPYHFAIRASNQPTVRLVNNTTWVKTNGMFTFRAQHDFFWLGLDTTICVNLCKTIALEVYLKNKCDQMEAINTDGLTRSVLLRLNKDLSEEMEDDCVFINSVMAPPLDDEFRVALEEIKSAPGQSEQSHLIVMLQTNGGLMETVERLVAVMRTHYDRVWHCFILS